MILYYTIYVPLSYILSSLPIKIQDWLADFIYFVLYRVVRYRVKVVRTNLKNSFPDKDEKWLKDIEVKFYRNLSDYFIEILTMLTLSREEGMARMRLINADQIDKLFDGKSVISAGAHFGNWEYTAMFGSYIDKHLASAVYHPLENKAGDIFFRNIRMNQGIDPVPMQQILRFMIKAQREKRYYVIGFIADQNPPLFKNEDKQMWYDFLGRKTLFFNGIEKIALKMKIPVVFLHIDKVARHHYIGWDEVIYDGNEEVEKGEITRRYVERVENMILERPELWLWSHKRWKHVYSPQESND